MYNLEVMFTNGDYRRFPSVEEDTIVHDEKSITFIFGRHEEKSKAYINLSNVNFMEKVEEES